MMVYQRDIEVTTNFAFAICSVGALMSVVFAIMGIKWWFRRRITFVASDNEQRERYSATSEGVSSTDNHAEQLSLMNTGVYRRRDDADGFVPIERPKTLPPVKIKNEHFNQRRRLPIPRPQSSYDSSGVQLERFPEPDEVISIAPRTHAPPPTPSSPNRNELSQPVVVDIHIPDDEGTITIENNLEQPEMRQKLEPVFQKVKPRQKTLSYIEMDGGPGGDSDKEPSEARASLQYENVEDDEGFVMEINENYEPYRTVIELTGDLPSRSSLDADAIESDANKSLGTSPSSNSWIPNPIMKPRRSFLSEASSDSNPVLNVTVDSSTPPPPIAISASNPELDWSLATHEAALNNQVRAQSADDALDMDMTPLDVSKIVSPLPKRSKRGLVKNRRAPQPPAAPIPLPTREDSPIHVVENHRDDIETEVGNIEEDVTEGNVTRIYINPNGDDWFAQKAAEIEAPPAQWDNGNPSERHDFQINRAVSVEDEAEIVAALKMPDPRFVHSREEKLKEQHDINQNFITHGQSHGFSPDEEKIFESLGIDPNLVKVAPIPKPRPQLQDNPTTAWEVQKVENDSQVSVPPTPPATSPPLFEDDFAKCTINDTPSGNSRHPSKNEPDENRRPSVLELYVEDDVVKTPKFQPKDLNQNSTDDYKAAVEQPIQSQSRPVPKARTTSLEDLTRDNEMQLVDNTTSSSSATDDDDDDENDSVPRPPPRLKIYSINSTQNANSTQNVKSILKNKNKNVTFDEMQPTVIVPTLISPESVPSTPGLTPITPMSELNSPPLTPAPVFSGSAASPVLVPREYRRGLLDPITEVRRSDMSSEDYDTDSLEDDDVDEKKPTNGGRPAPVDNSDSDDESVVRTRMITGPKVMDSRHSQMMDELRDRQTRRDYVMPRNLREMRQQQQQSKQQIDDVKFRDSLSEDESII